MATSGTAVLVHPATRRPERPALLRHVRTIGAELLFAAALVVGGTLALTALLVAVLLAAPAAALLVGWLAWRAGDDGERRARRVRARLRRRARALGLVVMAGAARPAAVRVRRAP